MVWYWWRRPQRVKRFGALVPLSLEAAARRLSGAGVTVTAMGDHPMTNAARSPTIPTC